MTKTSTLQSSTLLGAIDCDVVGIIIRILASLRFPSHFIFFIPAVILYLSTFSRILQCLPGLGRSHFCSSDLWASILVYIWVKCFAWFCFYLHTIFFLFNWYFIYLFNIIILSFLLFFTEHQLAWGLTFVYGNGRGDYLSHLSVSQCFSRPLVEWWASLTLACDMEDRASGLDGSRFIAFEKEDKSSKSPATFYK